MSVPTDYSYYTIHIREIAPYGISKYIFSIYNILVYIIFQCVYCVNNK